MAVLSDTVVEPQPDVTLDIAAIRAQLKTSLADYKVPKHIEIQANLPREDSGKIFKRRLRDPHWERAGRTRLAGRPNSRFECYRLLPPGGGLGKRRPHRPQDGRRSRPLIRPRNWSNSWCPASQRLRLALAAACRFTGTGAQNANAA